MFRGRPEPAFVFALYSGAGDSVRLVARAIVEVPMDFEGDFPTTVKPAEPRVMDADVPPEGPLLLLGVAVEIDSRELLQHLYARVEQPDRFHVWRTSDHTPAPLDLAELMRGEAPLPGTTERLNLMWDDVNLESVGKDLGDDYVGAAALVLGGPVRANASHRMHFSCADERNDWTVNLTIGERW